jgi:gliding motility-associated lipoprotein GldJ
MKTLKYSILIAIIFALYSCGKEQSSTTGWNYNDQENGGFQKMPFEEQETGPNLVLIEGGTFTMGRNEQDVMYDWQNYPRRMTVSSFYMDETEVKNYDWLEYLYWLNRVYGLDYPEVVAKAKPDTLVWREKLAYNEPFVDYYLRHPAYRDYPVVGITWLQANDYCLWRTDRVNEHIMIREGILEHYTDQTGEDNFNTDAYLAGQYESGKNIEGLPDFSPNGTGYRRVQMEDGILLPKYRLPTEAEWEYAAYGLIGNSLGERVIERRLWPWNGHAVRNPEEKYIGSMLANFKRGRGDYMGVAGKLNDNASITAPVYAYWPNDYGLYNMAGNVSEWVMDVYRPLNSEDNSDLNAFRGNVYKKLKVDEEGYVEEKDSLGHLQYENVTDEENIDRRNYQRADNINHLDGDYQSHIDKAHWEKGFENEDEKKTETTYMYEYSGKSLVDDNTRVYKGGSWRDRAYYMNPGSRRFLEEEQRTSYIGFRCAMDRVGSPVGLGGK